MLKKLLTNWSFVAGDFGDENPVFFATKLVSENVIGCRLRRIVDTKA